FFSFGYFLEIWIDLWALFVPQFQFRKSPFVVDANSSPILDSAKNVIYVDVVAEHCRGTTVATFNWSAGKTDKAGIWKRVPNVPNSWPSRSIRSVRTTRVGFSIAGCRISFPA